MDTVRRNEQIQSINSHEKLRAELSLKQKMSANKKSNQTSLGNSMPKENSRPELYPQMIPNVYYESTNDRRH